jgi:hypothetical protein
MLGGMQEPVRPHSHLANDLDSNRPLNFGPSPITSNEAAIFAQTRGLAPAVMIRNLSPP